MDGHRCKVHCPKGADWSWLLMAALVAAMSGVALAVMHVLAALLAAELVAAAVIWAPIVLWVRETWKAAHAPVPYRARALPRRQPRALPAAPAAIEGRVVPRWAVEGGARERQQLVQAQPVEQFRPRR